MRVLHICPSFWPNLGGVEKLIYELAVESRRAGLDVAVLTLRDPSTLPARDEVAGIPVHRVRFLDLRYYKPSLLPLSLLRAADVLHVHNVGAPLDFTVATRWSHRRPIVLNTNGGIFHTSNLSLLKRAYFHGVQSWLGRFVDRVVAISESDLRLYQPIARRIDLVEPGVDVERYRACAPGPKEPGRFLFVGRLSRNKRIDLLLRAFAALREREVPFRLRVVGPDWEELLTPLRALAAELGISGQVDFVGAVPDAALLEEYRRARYFVSASEYEGFGISLLEAMAAGCVPVVHPNDSFRSLIADGRNGFLADFGSAPEAAGALARAAAADPEPLVRAAARTADEYSWPSRIEKLMRVYEEVVAR